MADRDNTEKLENRKNSEKRLAYWRAYYRENKDKIRSRQKSYHQEYYKSNKERFRANSKAWNLKSKYGLTPKAWEDLFNRQGRVCGSCGSQDAGHSAGWHTDHCHQTGAVRGILCAPCNRALGYAKECPDRLRKLAEYAAKHSTPD
jgi:hypothetical protein